MVLTSIFTTMPGVLIWILPLLAVSLILRSSWLKGIIGERRVKHLIRRRLDPSIYREFSNVTVRVGDRTTQIDHIYVCPFGIRSEEHTSELQSLMRISYAVFCLKKNIN